MVEGIFWGQAKATRFSKIDSTTVKRDSWDMCFLKERSGKWSVPSRQTKRTRHCDRNSSEQVMRALCCTIVSVPEQDLIATVCTQLQAAWRVEVEHEADESWLYDCFLLFTGWHIKIQRSIILLGAAMDGEDDHDRGVDAQSSDSSFSPSKTTMLGKMPPRESG